MTDPSGLHLGDELSALLDGELTAGERSAVQAHLAECDECNTELEATRLVRDRLRRAPPVDPPFGFYERMLRKKRRWPVVASVAAVAAIWVAVAGFVFQSQPGKQTPPVDGARALASDPNAPSTGGLTLHRAERASTLPNELAGLPRQSTFKAFLEGGDATVGVFGTSPDQRLVAYVVRGDVDWSTLKGGIREPVEGLPGNPWRSVDPNAMNAIVVQSGDSTVLVTGTVPMTTLEEAAREIGDPEEPSALDHLRDAADAVVEGFSLR
jgi:hypothetical protein